MAWKPEAFAGGGLDDVPRAVAAVEGGGDARAVLGDAVTGDAGDALRLVDELLGGGVADVEADDVAVVDLPVVDGAGEVGGGDGPGLGLGEVGLVAVVALDVEDDRALGGRGELEPHVGGHLREVVARGRRDLGVALELEEVAVDVDVVEVVGAAAVPLHGGAGEAAGEHGLVVGVEEDHRRVGVDGGAEHVLDAGVDGVGFAGELQLDGGGGLDGAEVTGGVEGDGALAAGEAGGGEGAGLDAEAGEVEAVVVPRAVQRDLDAHHGDALGGVLQGRGDLAVDDGDDRVERVDHDLDDRVVAGVGVGAGHHRGAAGVDGRGAVGRVGDVAGAAGRVAAGVARRRGRRRGRRRVGVGLGHAAGDADAAAADVGIGFGVGATVVAASRSEHTRAREEQGDSGCHGYPRSSYGKAVPSRTESRRVG